MRPLWLFLTFLVVCCLGAPALAAPGRSGPGKIRGRVQIASATGPYTCLIDGTRVTARWKGSSFTVKDIPAGPHTLSVLSGAGAGVHRAVSVRSQKTAQVGALSLAAGGQITGLVSHVNAETGEPEPLAGVEVIAEPDWKEGMGRPTTGVRLVTVTDETGAYQFRAVPAGSYQVSVVVPGLAAGLEYVWVDAGHTSVADFLLEEAIEDGVGSLSGTVTDLEGQPLEGAMVTVYSTDYFPAAVSAASRRHAAAKGRSLPTVPRGTFATLTDQFGHYSLNLPTGHLWAEVWADGYLPIGSALTLHPHEALTLDAALEPDQPIGFGMVEGIVTDAATGLPLARVQVTVLVPTAQFAPDPHLTTFTDEKGYYRISAVPQGSWGVQAYAKGYAPGIGQAEFGELPVTLDFALKAETKVPNGTSRRGK